jgi:hypothetical protein
MIDRKGAVSARLRKEFLFRTTLLARTAASGTVGTDPFRCLAVAHAILQRDDSSRSSPGGGAGDERGLSIESEVRV